MNASVYNNITSNLGTTVTSYRNALTPAVASIRHVVNITEENTGAVSM